MQRSLRQTLCILVALGLITSFPMDDGYARGGGGRGGGGGRSGGGASPRVNRSVSTQNRGNFNSRPQSSVDRSQRQQSHQTNTQSRQGERTQRQGERQTTQQSRQGERTDRQGERQTTQQDRQSQRTDRQGERQEQATDRQNNRQDFVDDNYNGDRWYGGGWNGNGYYVPSGWGWAGLATGLAIGAAVATPPPYYDTVYAGSTSYIYSDGVYMQPSGSSYTIVAPPVGAVVTYLPDSCTTTQINNIPIYNCSGIYYQPFFQNGSTVYQVVQF